MNLSVLLEADIAIQIHAIFALIAVLLGAILLSRKKGNLIHIYLGRIWSVSMVVVIVSSAFISELRIWGPFSPIHIFTLLGTWALVEGIYHIRKGNVTAHKSAMKSLYFWGLGVAGTLAFMPGRVMNAIFFPNSPVTGFYLVLVLFLLGMALKIALGRGLFSRLQEKISRR
ncbi:MAG: DUF2306 domain-containing protein [Devosiaceae bacterium]|nr:DUF2306 domain-containing protein [Devosiaceae bacterium]